MIIFLILIKKAYEERKLSSKKKKKPGLKIWAKLEDGKIFGIFTHLFGDFTDFVLTRSINLR